MIANAAASASGRHSLRITRWALRWALGVALLSAHGVPLAAWRQPVLTQVREPHW